MDSTGISTLHRSASPPAGGATLADLGLANQAAVPPPYGFAIQCRVTSEDPEQVGALGAPPPPPPR
jgi:pyruvate carboxylase